MLDVINQDYIKNGKGQRVKESKVIFKHAMRNAILPIVTYLGPLISGSPDGQFCHREDLLDTGARQLFCYEHTESGLFRYSGNDDLFRDVPDLYEFYC